MNTCCHSCSMPSTSLYDIDVYDMIIIGIVCLLNNQIRKDFQFINYGENNLRLTYCDGYLEDNQQIKKKKKNTMTFSYTNLN